MIWGAGSGSGSESGKVKSGCACLVVSHCDTHAISETKREGIVINNNYSKVFLEKILPHNCMNFMAGKSQLKYPFVPVIPFGTGTRLGAVSKFGNRYPYPRHPSFS